MKAQEQSSAQDSDSQSEYDIPIEDENEIQNAQMIHESPEKGEIIMKGRKSQSVKQLGQQNDIKLNDDAPLRQQTARTRRQFASQNTDINLKKGPVTSPAFEQKRTIINTLPNRQPTDLNSKKKEESDMKAKKNSTKVIDLSSQEDDILNNSVEEEKNQPLRQRKDQPQQSKQASNKTEKTSIRQFPLQKSTPLQVQQPLGAGLQPSQQNDQGSSKVGESKQIGISKQDPPPAQTESAKEESGEKKKLTINEMEAMSKLLSIQADGLKMKQQRMLSNLSNPRGGMGMNHNKNGMNMNHSIHNMLNGLHPHKKLKPNGSDIPGYKQAIVQRNISNLMNQMPGYDEIVIDEEYEEDIENNVQDNQRELSPSPYPVASHGSRTPLRSLTPQNKTMQYQPCQQQQQQQQQQPQQQHQQPIRSYGYGGQNNYSQYNKQAVTGVQAYSRQGQTTPITKVLGGKVTPIASHQGGKLTPMNQNQMMTMMNNNVGGKITPGMRGNGNITPRMMGTGNVTPRMMGAGKITPIMNHGNGHQGNRTPVGYGQQQQQQQAKTLLDIENEIQSRIESIKNEIGPLLACLSSDLMGQNIQLPPQQQQTVQTPKQGVENMSDSFLNRRIYQDMRDRRTHTFEQQQQEMQQQQQQQQQQPLRGRSITPVNRRPPFESDNQNQGRNVTPLRSGQQQAQQQQQHQDMHNQQIGRKYDARAGDWLCGNCRNFNFAYRDVCNRCGEQQDENVHMVHPKITDEALNLIHELNHGIKKTPIRTVDDVKRTFQNVAQNKENLKNISNVNNTNHQNNFYQNKNRSFYNETNQIHPLKGGPRRPPLSYKMLEETSFDTNFNKKENQNDNSNKPSNKDIKPAEMMKNQIVFIDNSSAQPAQEANQASSSNAKDIPEGSSVDPTTNQPTASHNLRKKPIDPRIQIR